MNWIDQVEFICSSAIGVALILLTLHFFYSVFLDIQRAWPSIKDRYERLKEGCRYFLSDLWFLLRER